MKTLAFAFVIGSCIAVCAQDRPAVEPPKPLPREGLKLGERTGEAPRVVVPRDARPTGQGTFIRMNPALAAIDTNSDGIISAAEIDNAPAALRKLDKNGDGQLTEDELRPTALARPVAPAADANEAIVNRLMAFDKDGDGKLSKAEMPERMQALFDRLDTNKDGILTREEISKLRNLDAPREGARPGGDREREGRPIPGGGDRPQPRPVPER